MQVTPTSVVVLGPDNEAKTIDNPTVLMADFGLWVKTDKSLSLYTWERVAHIEFGDEKSVQKVWEEAILTVFEDLLDDMEEDMEFEEEVETAQPETPSEESKEEPANADDPNANPYN
tara:strand:- start:760 stop:1110 length:351 start_codon:yes stop_codon:yes gene_type:complete